MYIFNYWVKLVDKDFFNCVFEKVNNYDYLLFKLSVN